MERPASQAPVHDNDGDGVDGEDDVDDEDGEYCVDGEDDKNDIRDEGSTADLVLVSLVHLVHCYLEHWYPLVRRSFSIVKNIIADVS